MRQRDEDDGRNDESHNGEAPHDARQGDAFWTVHSERSITEKHQGYHDRRARDALHQTCQAPGRSTTDMYYPQCGCVDHDGRDGIIAMRTRM